jgi:methyl-accepting chemotaxis protein
MADNKDSMSDDSLPLPSEGDNAESKPEKQRKRVRRSTAKVKTETVKTETEYLEDSFAIVAEQGEAIVKRFYERLFEQYPETKALFGGVSVSGQEKKLLASLVLLVQNIEKTDVLHEYLTGLGARHKQYGVTAEDYPKVTENLLTVLEEFAGDVWTSEVSKAWQNTLNRVAQIMLDAYEPMETEEMAMTENTIENQELISLRVALSNSKNAMLMIDKDLNITYVNQTAIKMFEKYESNMQAMFRGFSADNLIGQNIDQFHKDPSVQRRLLADVNNLPYTTDIKFGGLDFNLYVQALVDDEGNHFGAVLEWTDNTETQTKMAVYQGQVDAISKSMGVISFTPEGVITDVNENFLSVVGYTKDEVVGNHHRMFAPAGVGESQAYAEFWAKLGRGEFDSGQYQRVGKGGKDIWLEASYNPIFDTNGKVIAVIKYATDITAAKLTAADNSGQLSAIDKAMGVISFDMDGTIIDINDNFLAVVGYSRDEVIGKHHRMFAPTDFAGTQAYADFWAKLNRGEFDSGQYERVGKGGKEVWLEASYNPIFDLSGKPYKVVKYAADITQQKQLQNTVQQILAETSTVMNAMAEGKLTEKINGYYEGDFANLKQAINTTVDKIAETMAEISETSVSIGAAASEISKGNIDLSRRTESQASSLEETASSMEELTSTVRQNSDNAAQANQLAASAREQAEKGGSVIRNAITAMAAISTASKKVADIIGVIDEIAFQTNLLALNAAVEAARAGEQGRGFAVVASEVRNLAQRSAAAAKEIKELISDSGEKVKEGSMLVDESGRTLEEIVAGAKRVGDIISEIAAAGAEQTSGITQVNLAVGQMDDMTQQNAALVEEAAAASESLDEQGQTLQRLIAFFDTGVESTAQLAPASAAPRPEPVTTAPEPIRTPAAVPAIGASSDDEWDEF